MKTCTVQTFHEGIADDIFDSVSGQFSIAKQFDILSYPRRLQPLRGMTADTTGTAIGNIILSSIDGLMYGLGIEPGFTVPALFKKSGYGASDGWASLAQDGTGVAKSNAIGGNTYTNPMLVEFTNAHVSNRKFYWTTSLGMYASGASGIADVFITGGSTKFTCTNQGQGFVHPKDQILYVPYDNFIGTITNSAETINTTVWTLPTQYFVPCLTNYGNYLAIPAYTLYGASQNSSIVYLCGRDTSIATFDESIPWGAGQLQVLNNLEGVLIGISSISSLDGSQNQDVASITIKGYNGGTDPFLIKEIKVQHLGNTSHPQAVINPNVNFIYNKRLYFSVNIIPADGVSNSYYGLWSVGKNKVNGQYTVTMERVATNGNTETGVLAAAFNGDFVAMVHSSVGTITCSINGATASTTYAATSVYESIINPNMLEIDWIYNKTLLAVGVQTYPLQSNQQVIMKYRIDSNGSWTTLFTKTSSSPDTNLTAFELSLANNIGSISGRNIEFRLESTGGAVITGYSYKYDILKTNL